MDVNLHEIIDTLQQAHRAITRSYDPAAALTRLRHTVDHARRLLNHLPSDIRDGRQRLLARQLVAEIELAEGSLRGREPQQEETR